MTFDFTVELAHAAYYKVSGTLTLLRLGFGLNDIWFTDTKHYCSNFYLDSRALETSVVFETNTKPCQLKVKSVEENMGYHWDSRESLFFNSAGSPTANASLDSKLLPLQSDDKSMEDL